MRAFAATCAAKVVTVIAPVPVPGAALLPVATPPIPTPVPVADATILSEGVGPSTGVALVDESGVYYVPSSTAADLKTTIEKLIDVIGQVKTGLDQTVEAVSKAATALTSIDTRPYLASGDGVPGVPTAAADIAGIATASAQVTAAGVQLEAISVELTAFKEVLK